MPAYVTTAIRPATLNIEEQRDVADGRCQLKGSQKNVNGRGFARRFDLPVARQVPKDKLIMVLGNRPLPSPSREQERLIMPDERFYRQQARDAMRSASDAIDPELAEYYRALAAAYIALARFFERFARYRRVDEEAQATARPVAH